MSLQAWSLPIALGQAAILPRPRGGDWLEDDLATLRRAGFNTLISLLTPAETASLELARESVLVEALGMCFVNLPIEDRDVPDSMNDFLIAVRRLKARLDAGERIGVHCRQGIGRSGLVMATLLLLDGRNLGEALATLTTLRGVDVPETTGQQVWLEKLARILER